MDTGIGLPNAVADTPAPVIPEWAFAQAGCDELIFIPCAADPDQAGLLAEALHG